MDLKQEALQTYGVTLRLVSGGGSKENPFILEPCTATQATHTQLEAIRLINYPQGFIYRLFEVASVPEAGPRIQAIAFERAHISDPTDKTTVACYFDWSAVDGEPHAGDPLFVWHDPRSPVMLPHELGWLHFTKYNDYAGEDASLYQSCSYHAPDAAATIYVYAHGQPHATARERAAIQAAEMEEVLNHVLADQRDFRPTHDPMPIGRFDLRILAAAEDTTFVALACVGTSFVKARITFKSDKIMLLRMVQTLQELSNHIDQQSPAPVR